MCVCTKQRSWYVKSEVNKTVWTDVYQFAATEDFGITAARRWVDPVSGRTVRGVVPNIHATCRVWTALTHVMTLRIGRHFSWCSPWTC